LDQFAVGAVAFPLTAEPGTTGERSVKYMILTDASQQDDDAMAGKATDKAAWSPEDFAAMGAFMESFNQEPAGVRRAR
jgi:hypothetical protein